MSAPIFNIPNYNELPLEILIKTLKEKYIKDINEVYLINYSITTKTYYEKVDEIELIVKDFNSDLTYYLNNFKNTIDNNDVNIIYLVNYLLTSVWNEMSSTRQSSWNYMLSHIED